jgi:hypothetical protein
VNRRAILQALLGLGTAPALQLDAQETLALTPADAVAEGSRRFFDDNGFADFRHLGSLLVPAFESRPGAVEAEAPEFLDFLLSQSPPDLQAIYREGVRQLGAQARRRYDKPFAQLTVEQASPLLAPLEGPWTYEEPKEAQARFLRAAKIAMYQATVNSSQWAAAGRSRRAAGVGSYWLPVE